MKNANKRVQGTLHKVSGPLTRDVLRRENMMNRIAPILTLCALAFLGAAVYADNGTADRLKDVVGSNLAAQTNHDFDRWLSTYHPGSSFRRFILDGRKIWEAQQANPSGPRPPEFRFTLKSFTVLGSDDDYLVARVKEEKRLAKQMIPPMPEFPYQFMVSDVLYVFRKYEGVWLIWTTKALSEEYETIPDAEQGVAGYRRQSAPQPDR